MVPVSLRTSTCIQYLYHVSAIWDGSQLQWKFASINLSRVVRFKDVLLLTYKL